MGVTVTVSRWEREPHCPVWRPRNDDGIPRHTEMTLVYGLPARNHMRMQSRIPWRNHARDCRLALFITYKLTINFVVSVFSCHRSLPLTAAIWAPYQSLEPVHLLHERRPQAPPPWMWLQGYVLFTSTMKFNVTFTQPRASGKKKRLSVRREIVIVDKEMAPKRRVKRGVS